MKDLVLLVADKNMHFALKGALERPKAMGIRPIQYEIPVHPGRDGGMRKSGPEILALERRRFTHALAMLDFEGSGTDLANGKELEARLDHRLRSAWNTQAKAIVIEPELDVWMWGSDNAIQQVIRWPSGKIIRQWLREHGFQLTSNGKPERPKEALESLLRELKIPRSSSLYQDIAGKISLAKCKDEAFQRLRRQLVAWFPPPGEARFTPQCVATGQP
jgi:hypothetical protein